MYAPLKWRAELFSRLRRITLSRELLGVLCNDTGADVFTDTAPFWAHPSFTYSRHSTSKLIVSQLTNTQSFVNSPILFKNVERPVFSAVQGKMFPIYFALQTALPVVLALTFPGSSLQGFTTGISGLLDATNRWGSFFPVTAMFVAGLLNLTVLLPASQKVIKQRQGQGMPHPIAPCATKKSTLKLAILIRLFS